jgi:predicted O-linked N-acetylglucosamine transferase (SPINDLY family)
MIRAPCKNARSMIWWKKSPSKPLDPGEIDALWREAFGHHQAGHIDQAAKLYRSVLQHAPHHFDARHLLGVTALQQGRLDDAQREIGAAIEINPRDAAAHNNMGTVWLRRGHLEHARESFEAALKLRPGDADANANLGAVLVQLGDAARAVPMLRKAIAQRASPELRNQLAAALLASGDAASATRELRVLVREHPGNADAHNHLGLALEQIGDAEGAMTSYDRALALAGDHGPAASNRAALLAKTGRLEEARSELEKLARAQPGSASVHANLGAVHRDRGDLAAARASLQKALQLEPGLAAARLTLADALIDGSDLDAAQRELDTLLEVQPNEANAWVSRGRLAFMRGDLPAADAALVRAVELAPNLADAHHVLGLVKEAMGDAPAARRCHERASELDPTHPQARWAAVTARLPGLPPTEEEAMRSSKAFAAGLQELERWYGSERAPTGFIAVGSTQPFFLAYQAGNHRDLLQAYGRLCTRLMSVWPGAPAAPAKRARGGKLRLGVVSAHVGEHSVWTALMRGLLPRIDRRKIELHLFNLRVGPGDVASESVSARVHRAPASLTDWVQRIASSELDVLLYPEIGMDAMTLRLAALRLAPLQLATWGHPITTGLPTIDAFVSADAMEPAGAEDQYVEKLVRLPGLGVCYEALNVRDEAIDLAALGLPLDKPLLLCPGMPFKYAPKDDAVWADIARLAPEAHLVFFEAGPPLSNSALRERLERAFAAQGLDFAAHASFVKVLSRPQFFALMRRSALFLDTIGFSGFNTVMQAIECALPVVTVEGDALRGRFGSGVLREMGLGDCVAKDASDYVEIALRLVHDAAHRADVKARMLAAKPRVFATEASVRAFESFLLGGSPM